jgi:glucoamylase
VVFSQFPYTVLAKMIPVVPFVVVAYLALYAFAFSIPTDLLATQRPLRDQLSRLSKEKADFGPQSSLDAWIEEEEKIALRKLLNNIAPGGVNAPNAAPGSVIASPSKEHPNYYYQCEYRHSKLDSSRTDD